MSHRGVATTTYVYDYANRLIALGSQGATTTFGYDAFGSRVFQSTSGLKSNCGNPQRAEVISYSSAMSLRAPRTG